jgi:hypothetical protein
MNVASEALRRIEPRVSRVTITAADQGIDVRIHGASIPPSDWAAGVAVDGGEHVVTATAPRKKTWRASVRVADAQDVRAITVPALEDEAAPIAPPSAPARDVDTARIDTTAPSAPSSTKRTLGFALGGAGIVALGVGTYLGLHALSLQSDRGQHCQGLVCNTTGRSAER